MMDLRNFNSFVTKYQQRFIHFAETYVHDKMIAEDIVMEAFMYYWENREHLTDETNIPAYVLTAVKHKCIDNLREQKHYSEISGEPDEVSAWELSFRIDALENFEPYELFTSEIELLVRKTLSELPEQTRIIFLMSRYENKSHNEIAQIIGISTKGVEFHISKAIRSLRVSLKDYLPSVVIFF